MKAVSSMATRHVLAELADAAVATGLPPLGIESVGGVDAARRVRKGEQFDLVFLAGDALRALAVEGHVYANTVTALVESSVAVAVPASGVHAAPPADAPAFANAAAVRDTVAAADRIGYSTGPSGTTLLGYIEDWGLSHAAGRLVQARPGIPVARLLAEGQVDLGFQQYSEFLGQPGIRILGVLPPDCAITTVFAGAIASTASDPLRAHTHLRFFTANTLSAVKVAHGFAVPRMAVAEIGSAF